MLSVFVGDDVARAKAEALSRAKGREVVRFGEGGEPFLNVGGYLAQTGMFAPKLALILDRPFDTAEIRDSVLDLGDALVEADAHVFVITDSIDATTKKKLPKGTNIEEFETKSTLSDVPPPNVFALTDAYAAGDRKRAWVTYRALIASGASAEEVHGALAWSVRSMVLAAKTQSAGEAGMKDYPFRKARDAVRRIGAPKAEALSSELVSIYHEARMGQGDLEDLLELFILQK